MSDEATVVVQETWRAYFDEDARSWAVDRWRKIGDGRWEHEVTLCPDEQTARRIAITGHLPKHFGR